MERRLSCDDSVVERRLLPDDSCPVDDGEFKKGASSDDPLSPRKRSGCSFLWLGASRLRSSVPRRGESAAEIFVCKEVCWTLSRKASYCLLDNCGEAGAVLFLIWPASSCRCRILSRAASLRNASHAGLVSSQAWAASAAAARSSTVGPVSSGRREGLRARGSTVMGSNDPLIMRNGSIEWHSRCAWSPCCFVGNSRGT